MTDPDERTTFVLADLTRSIRLEQIPQGVVSKAKELILDSIACIMGGVNTEQGRKMRDLYGSMAGLPEASVYGTRQKMPLLNAVAVNAYLSTVLDFDDTYDGHPGSTVIPVALSIGERENVSGRLFLESVVAGYEIGIRVSNGIKPTPERTKQVRGINTWQIFCAAATAVKLYGLDRDLAAHAYGHAALHAPVPTLRKWGFIDGKIQWLKNNFGWTSYGGVLSAQLARMGFLADTTIMDGPDGFWIMASSDQCNYEALRESLETYYTPMVHTKPYTACRHIHPTLDAVASILAGSDLSPGDIGTIEVGTFYEVVENYGFFPSVPFDIPYSAPFLVSLLIHGIPAGTEWLQETHLKDESILSTARKVILKEWDEATTAYPLVKRELMSRVEIKTRAGKSYSATTRIPKGDPRNPMSP
jgi:2-methylcitrate dehydratase PrpD